MHNWRIELTVITDDLATHEHTSYQETRCGICNAYIHLDVNTDQWIHSASGTELCHERAA